VCGENEAVPPVESLLFPVALACKKSGFFPRIFGIVQLLVFRRHLKELHRTSIISSIICWGIPWLITCIIKSPIRSMKERSWLVLLAEMNKRQEINLKETKVFASFEDLFGQLIFTASFKVYHRDALACVHADRPLLLWEYVGLRHYISPANPICHQFLHSFSLKLSNALAQPYNSSIYTSL